MKAQLKDLKRLKQGQGDKDAQGVELSFYLCDHLGTPNALVDRQGNIIWAAQLDAWGNIQEEFNPAGLIQSIRLPGQYEDRKAGLYYNRFRHYDPTTAIYISQDPIGFVGGLHSYRYTDNPYMLTDPLGLQAGRKHMQQQIEDIRADGTGVRLGGAEASLGGAGINAGTDNASISMNRDIGSISIGRPCANQEVSVFSRGWNMLKKLFAGENVRGPGVSIDPVCIDPGQVLNRTAAEGADIILNNSGGLGQAVDVISNRETAIDAAIDAATKRD